MSSQEAQSLLLLAEHCFRDGRYAPAQHLLRDVLRIQPFNARANEYMAYIAGNNGELEQAYRLLLVASKQPDCSMEAVFYLGRLHLQRGECLAAISCFEVAIEQVGACFELCHELGLACAAAGLHARAVEELSRAGEFRPDSPEVLTNLGSSLRCLGRYEESLSCHLRACALQPDRAECWGNAGNVLHDLRRHREAIDSYHRALQLAPRYVEAWSNLGNVLSDLNRHEEALAAYDRALELNPDDGITHWNKASSLLVQGEFASGWEGYEYRWQVPGQGVAQHEDTPRLKSLDGVAGKTVLVWAEQGFGDTLQFARYIPLLIGLGAKVVFEVQPLLVPLFAGGFNCSVVARSTDNVIEADCQIPLLSLPRLFGTTLANIPLPSALHINPDRVKTWQTRLSQGARRKIGIACSGNPAHKNDRNRSMDLAHFVGLKELGTLFLIQKEVRQADRDVLEANPEIIFLGDEIADFADTAAIVAQMDLIVSVDTSLAHLAATLGCPTWVLLPWAPEWRWLMGRSDSPWYPCARLFRQPALGDWTAVIASVRQALSHD